VKMTPMLRQYLDLKEQAGSALLLYRMGDFYELFFEDAQQAAPVLGITLTRRRQNDSVDAPMCGVPHHAFDGYLGKLLDAGFRVAVAEQVEDPAKAKGLSRDPRTAIWLPSGATTNPRPWRGSRSAPAPSKACEAAIPKPSPNISLASDRARSSSPRTGTDGNGCGPPRSHGQRSLPSRRRHFRRPPASNACDVCF